MIGLALSGGGSRAIAFHLGCLRALDALGVLDRVGVISTISGGSVIGAYYAYTPGLSFREFDDRMVRILETGFQWKILGELAKPANLGACIASSLLSKIAPLGALVGIELPVRRYRSRTDMFRKVLARELFADLEMRAPRRNDIEAVVGACELRSGTAFRFGNSRSGSWRFGALSDNRVDVALAVAASAAFPLLLPALDRLWTFDREGRLGAERVLLTDGGVYDNLGVQVLEPGRDPGVSLHVFPCDYLIVCHAGHGLAVSSSASAGPASRMKYSINIMHRRVQDAAMGRLHRQRESGLLRGFAMPYLGQRDDRLPTRPADLVRRGEVASYPTDFSPMTRGWIDRLSLRGEQLTRILVPTYLPELL